VDIVAQHAGDKKPTMAYPGVVWRSGENTCSHRTEKKLHSRLTTHDHDRVRLFSAQMQSHRAVAALIINACEGFEIPQELGRPEMALLGQREPTGGFENSRVHLSASRRVWTFAEEIA